MCKGTGPAVMRVFVLIAVSMGYGFIAASRLTAQEGQPPGKAAPIQELLKEEEAVDAEIRKKITSQKKEVFEGSEEWDLLYRKYYADEMRRMGIAHQPSAAGSTS